MSALELELERVNTQYQNSLTQKQTIEALLSAYKNNKTLYCGMTGQTKKKCKMCTHIAIQNAFKHTFIFNVSFEFQ